ncbi:MAG: fibro-slime domain-containing protein [Chitinivibrionales bacterium]|nr:fibro-slime domain-containing protein [Chitinivibrionales bacterium]
MKKMKKFIKNRQGYILIASTIIVVASTAMAVFMVRTAGRNAVDAQNMKNKAKAFYASDGIMTFLVQEITNGNAQEYLGSDDSIIIEAEHFANKQSAGSRDWIDDFSAQHSGSGAMKVEPNTGGFYESNYIGNSPRLDYNVCFSETGTHYVWIRGKGATDDDQSCHIGLNYETIATGERIENFSQEWSWVNTDYQSNRIQLEIPSAGSHVVNIWMCEDGFVIDKIIISNKSDYTITGMGNEENVCEGAGTWEVDNFMVDAKVEPKDQTNTVFDLTTDAYQYDADGNKIYSAPLEQFFSMQGSGASDVVHLEAIFYDYHCDGSNPNFQNCEYTKRFLDNRGVNFIQNTLTADRKPLRTAAGDVMCAGWWRYMCPDAANCGTVYNPQCHQWGFDPSDLSDACSGAQLPGTEGQGPRTSDMFNDWFWPSANAGLGGRDPGVEFRKDDPNPGWRWYIAGTNDELDYYDPAEPERGRVGPNFDPDYMMANVVVYVDLEFHRVEGNTLWDGTTVPDNSFICNPPPPDPDNPGQFLQPDYYPMDRKGFEPPDAARTTPLGNELCLNKHGCPRRGMIEPIYGCMDASYAYTETVDHNYSFAMELHTTFTYASGQILKFHGGDDYFVFINDQLALDMAGIDMDRGATIDLDAEAGSLGISTGNEYNLDIFWCERQTARGTLTITTNIDVFEVTGSNRRRWKRDYGMLD